MKWRLLLPSERRLSEEFVSQLPPQGLLPRHPRQGQYLTLCSCATPLRYRGKESKVRIVGSSCEKTAKPGGASQKSEAEQRGNIIMDEETKMSLSMQM